ncbi:MAG: phage portal protein [bacterium]|nr:phage portal protein [bacterium]
MQVWHKIKSLFERKSFFDDFFNFGGGLSGRSGGLSKDYGTVAREAYLKNEIVFRCVDLIGKAVFSVPWRLYRTLPDGKRELVTDHPVAKLLKKPSPHDSFSMLNLKTISYLLLSGDAYLQGIGPLTGENKGQVREMYTLRPDRVKVLPNDQGHPAGYRYRINSTEKTFPVDFITGKSEVLHLKLFHPLDDYNGCSPAEPASVNIDTSNKGTRWNKQLLENNAKPGMVYTVTGFLSDKQYKRLLKQIEGHSGNPNKSMILEGEKGSKATPFSFTPAEMDYIEGGRETARRIAFSFGVPPQLVGIVGDSTFANYQEARQSFWEDTAIFYLSLLKDQYNRWMFGEDAEYFLDYETEEIPALATRRAAIWERAEKSSFLKVNQKLEMVGKPTAGAVGDVILVPSNMIPLQDVVGPNTDEDLGDDEDD